MRQLGSAVGRGATRESLEVGRMVEEARDGIAKLIHAPAKRNIAFTFSCTDALNTAMLGLLQPADHVVTSIVEHNSVVRPLKHLRDHRSILVTYVSCDQQGIIDPTEVLDAITPQTRLVVLSHASNVTGAVQNLGLIGQTCRQKGIAFLVDAAQTIGYIPVDVRKLNCDVLAAAGHKGLLGPLGTGFLFYSDEMAERITPLRFGGTGTSQLTDRLPVAVPEKFEAGNLNMPGLAGLTAGLKFMGGSQWQDLKTTSQLRAGRLLERLTQLPDIRLHGPQTMEQRLPVFSISFLNLESHEAATILESQWCLQTRAGFQCAPLLHQRLGTEKWGGLVRISPGLFNTDVEIDVLLQALQEMTR